MGSRTHGHYDGDKPSYTAVSYQCMIARCYQPSTNGYANYGGRGIGVCARWRRSFQSFLRDMGERPVGTTLDRIDSEKDYGPANCRWASKSEQRRNMRSKHWITFRGETHSAKEWARLLGIPASTVYAALMSGETLEQLVQRRCVREPIPAL